MVKLVQHYKWNRVGILTQEIQRFTEMRNDLIKQLMQAGVQVLGTESLSSNPCVNLQKMKNKDVRIIIGQFEENSASEVFCCAYRLNMFGRKYQWILAGQSKSRWWLDAPATGCTSDNLLTAMDAFISLDIKQLSAKHTKGISGRTPHEYKKAYLAELVHRGTRASYLHGFAYDGVWVVAKALSQVMDAVKYREKYNIHRNFTITSEEIGQMFLDSMRQTQFEGVTGQVLFRNGERMTVIEFRQFQGGKEVVVGLYETYTRELQLIHRRIKFKGSRPAKDRTIVRQQQRQISIVLYSILSSATALAVGITFIVLCFTVKNRKHRLLKASGQFMDHLLIFGILLTCASIFLFGLDGALVSDEVLQVLCSVRLWVLSVGHTVGFGVLFASAWREFSVLAQNETRQKENSWGHRPTMVVAAMVLLDVAVLSCRQVLDPLQWVQTELSLKADPKSDDIAIRPYLVHCTSTSMDRWLTIVYAYKGPILGLGCFLSWNIRHAQGGHPLSDIKHLPPSICAVTVSSVLGALGSLLTYQQPNVQFCLTTLAILLCNMCILTLVFKPKILYIKNADKEMDQTNEVRGGTKTYSNSLGSGSMQDFGSGTCRGTEWLHSENHRLRRRITQLDMELDTTAMQLYQISESNPIRDHYTGRSKASEERSQCRRPQELTHKAQICSGDWASYGMTLPRTEDINSPEHVQRRLSLQLPILHHAYLPVIGGVTGSCSSLLDSPDTMPHPTLVVQR